MTNWMSPTSSSPEDEPVRTAELEHALVAVRRRIAAAATSAGRDPQDVTLIAVTKTYPASDAATLVSLGCADLGESRDQEAVAKVAATAELLGIDAGSPRWHFVGRLQSRKCGSVARYAAAVHSVDRAELVTGLADGVARAERAALAVFVQVSLDDDPARGGVAAAGVAALADDIASRRELRLSGVMAVAPLGADPNAAFAHLAEVAARLREHHPEAASISAGMSDDLEPAVQNGATHVRVGSALLGRRSPVFG
jgi:pyridoxal phosphate enzyme (YggS family)